ncbi:MAG: DoxX family membrane protein [Chthoniobacterales bacterium]|nr:DoxX family membrane protein [Chthoniobacterales bacterium]
MKISRVALALFFIVAGVNHFVSPAPYLAIMPPVFPWPLAWVYLSGAAEIAGGVGVLFPTTRTIAALGLIVLLIAVFPANIYAAVHGMRISGHAIPPSLLWLRLPFQAVLIAWVYFAGWKERRLLR